MNKIPVPTGRRKFFANLHRINNRFSAKIGKILLFVEYRILPKRKDWE